MSLTERVPYANLGAEDRAAAVLLDRDPSSPLGVLRTLWVDLVKDPPWVWLDETSGVVPWMSVDAARAYAENKGLPYAGAPTDVVRRVHDKRWAQLAARALAIDPELDDVIKPLTPLDGHVERVNAIVASWPAWAQKSFTLKPAWGTSGRGRIRGVDGQLDVPATWVTPIDHPGWVLEPWLQRVLDLSSLWFIDEHGEPRHLGVTVQKVRPSGLYVGADVVGTTGMPLGGSPFDNEFLEKSRRLVDAAARAGLRGPCGVDGFAYRDAEGEVRVRGAVELNARFTAGHVAVGLAERHRLAPGQRAELRLDDRVPFRVLGVES